ncbi:MAG: relaxase/mobilization nuclease domain-containing protein [Thiomonas arsenitoxydans]|uniref:Relaxase/mobilization nuclease domain-containing protein n=1 Tax=Thiomonas arsenitoxydans (strain DSM 22701 / CIP 110005 / 3As) TaxID=426114 RepID=A0A8I1MVJ2_THIA3|nr:TraI/MobA(P) family conjugative relaxase [Thiomonas arsenitoxydans]MBN8744555.1 relaxase/mobilization nuclease domain-containing protein [Thiomonas arsenitoxydans]
MLAKVIKLKNERGGRVSAHHGVQYIFREGGEEHTLERDVVGGSFNLELGDLDLADPLDRALAIRMMDYTAEAGRLRNRFTSNPFYHYAISWREGELPTSEQCREAAAHTLKALGMDENQAVWGLHTDREHHWHIHILANRVHPEKLNLSGPPKFDFLVLDKACRELELMQGWAHDKGPHVVIDGAIQRLSKRQREQLGLRKTDRAPTPGARAAEVHSGVPSLSEWLNRRAKDELLSARSWEELHHLLAERGCALRLSGGGLVIDTRLPDGRATSTKASGVHYSLSLGRLEKKFGTSFLAPDLSAVQAQPAKTYARFVDGVRAGTEPGLREIPGRTGSTPERQAKREARALARKELADTFKREQATQKQARGVLVSSLRTHHQAERAALRQKLKAIKPARIAQLTTEHGSKQIAQGLWAAEAVIRRQKLQKRQKAERTSLTKDAPRVDWVGWLERQAMAGDEAAASALRGIKYREGRQKNKSKNGFEGEDLDPLRAAAAEGGSIGGVPQDPTAGARKAFALEDARIQIDRRNQRIEYHDQAGQVRMTDSGPRVDVHVPDVDTIDAGLQLAAQKFGGETYITGDAAFREQSARRAVRLGVGVKDEDLQHIVAQERAQIEVERSPSRPRQPAPPRDPPPR